MSGAPDLAEAADNVILPDAAGAVTGEAPGAAVHTTTTQRHLGFSLYLFNSRQAARAGSAMNEPSRELGRRNPWPDR
jgi:hypothetical protein